MTETSNGSDEPTVPESGSWREQLKKERAKNLRSKTLGEMIYCLPWSILFTFLAASGVLLYRHWWFMGIVFIVASVIFFAVGIKTIPAVAPASFALLTFWGMRYPVVVREGKKLLATYPPLFIDLIPVSIEQQNLDFVFQHVRCRLERKEDTGKADPASGGAVVIEVSLTIVPNEERFEDYIIAGGESRSKTKNAETLTVLHDIIHDMLGEALRQEGGRRTWERMTFSQEQLTVMLITLLTGVDPKIESPFDTEDPEEQEQRTKELRGFLQEFQGGASGNGISDVHGLGAKIRRINVVRVEPDGKLADAAERAAIEQQERKAELIETGAVLDMAKLYVKQSEVDGKPTITLDRALQIARLERNKGTREVVVQSSGNPLLDAAALFQDRGQGG